MTQVFIGKICRRLPCLSLTVKAVPIQPDGGRSRRRGKADYRFKAYSTDIYIDTAMLFSMPEDQQNTEQTAEQISAALFSLLLSVARSMPRDLSRTGVATLNLLQLSGPQRITRLAELEGVTQPTMTTLLDRLENIGLVERHPDDSDGRATLISLSKSGVSYLSQRQQIGTRRIADLITRLPSDQTLRLADALAALVSLSQAAAIPRATHNSKSQSTQGGK